MTLDLFPKPDPARLRARKVSCDGLCGPSCPELEWGGMAKPEPRCKLFGARLAVDDGRARRCRECSTTTQEKP